MANNGLDNASGVGDSLKSGQNLSQFNSGFSRRRGGIEGRFANGQDPSGLKGTFYRDGMPAVSGSAPKLSSFADKSGRGQGVNFSHTEQKSKVRIKTFFVHHPKQMGD